LLFCIPTRTQKRKGMKVDLNTKLIQDLAHLSRLNLSGADAEAMQNDLQDILGWIDKLNEVDTEGVTPLTHLSEHENVMRADEVDTSFTHEQALENAPSRDASYFRVPKVMD